MVVRTACDLTNLERVKLDILLLHKFEHIITGHVWIVAHVGDCVPMLTEGTTILITSILIQPRLENDVNVTEVAGRPVRARTGSVVTRAPFGATSDTKARRLDIVEVRIDLRAMAQVADGVMLAGSRSQLRRGVRHLESIIGRRPFLCL